MAKTNAEYQRERRERRADRLAELETALADRDADLAAARARIERLERELDGVYAMLETASAAPEDAAPARWIPPVRDPVRRAARTLPPQSMVTGAERAGR
jgi:hypothetical protein